MEPLTVFIHIHKAAGNTIRALIADNCDESEVVDEFVIPRTFRDDGSAILVGDDRADTAAIVRQAQDPRVRFVALNVGYGLHRLVTRPVRYFSTVREPVARCVSFWYFAERMSEQRPWWDDFAAQDFDVERIVAGPRGSELVDNQIRMLLGARDRTITRRHLREAIERVARDYEVVGTVEDLPAVVEELCDRFGWKEREAGTENVGDYRDRSLLPDGARDVFERVNALDRELWEWIREDHLPRVLRRRLRPSTCA